MDNIITEIIDGVTIVHSGTYRFVTGVGGMIVPFEEVKMYDNDGNIFYSNFQSIEEAEQAILKFADEGINAVIGPKGPKTDGKGNFVKNNSNNEVGVYIISIPEKEKPMQKILQ